jgi:hypothetical protein
MTPQTAAFLLGCALVIIAIMGGGITAREITIPPLAIVPRLMCGVVGAALVVVGLNLLPMLRPATAAATTASACKGLEPAFATASQPVVEITDRLGDNQQFERIDFFVADRGVGTLCVDRKAPSARILIPLTGKEEPYAVKGTETTNRTTGPQTRAIEGEGTIDLRRPGRYSIRTNESSETVQRIYLRPY